MIGGRNFEPAARTTFTVALGGVTRDQVEPLPPGPFLRFIAVPPAETADLNGYYQVVVTSTPPVRIGVEQFDVSAKRPLVGYGAGWQEQEFNPRTGLRWRWLSERGELHLRAAKLPLTLHLEGESPLKYFSRGSRLLVRSGDRVAFDQSLSADFSLNIPIESAAETILLETDQVFAPADRSSRSADRRHLGLRIFKCELRPAK